MYSAFANELTPLRDAVRASASGTKGGQRGQFIDPTALLPDHQEGTPKLGQLSSPLPEDVLCAVQDQVRKISQASQRRIRSWNFATVATVEWHEVTDWAKEWRPQPG